MSSKLHTALWTATLVIALLGWTPLGQAAGSAVTKVVPLAKVANFAKNAGALDGHSASPRPRAGQVPVLNSRGKLPASIGAVGPAGAAGATGAAGGPGLSGYQQVTVSVPFTENGVDTTISCPGGKSVLGGGYNLNRANDNLTVFDSRPATATDWRIRIRNTTQGTGTVTLFAICATVAQ
ncbi:MAG TPA: hypothetical protein VGF66_06260 [Gaiellaceae bacterium]|jgi:hypothetical protein